MQPKVGGKLHLRLNTDTRPIADKYREGKLKRTLKREFKSTWNRSEANWWDRKVASQNSTLLVRGSAGLSTRLGRRLCFRSFRRAPFLRGERHDRSGGGEKSQGKVAWGSCVLVCYSPWVLRPAAEPRNCLSPLPPPLGGLGPRRCVERLRVDCSQCAPAPTA